MTCSPMDQKNGNHHNQKKKTASKYESDYSYDPQLKATDMRTACYYIKLQRKLEK